MSEGEAIGLFAGIFGALLGFGILYNAAINVINRKQLDEGYVGFEVAIGVVVTLLATGPLIGWRNVAILTGAFAASGIPMIVGDVWRYWERKLRSQEAMRRSVEHDNSSETMA